MCKVVNVFIRVAILQRGSNGGNDYIHFKIKSKFNIMNKILNINIKFKLAKEFFNCIILRRYFIYYFSCIIANLG